MSAAPSGGGLRGDLSLRCTVVGCRLGCRSQRGQGGQILRWMWAAVKTVANPGNQLKVELTPAASAPSSKNGLPGAALRRASALKELINGLLEHQTRGSDRRRRSRCLNVAGIKAGANGQRSGDAVPSVTAFLFKAKLQPKQGRAVGGRYGGLAPCPQN